MTRLIKSVSVVYAFSFSSFCSAAMFATSNDVPEVTFPLYERNDIYEGYTFVIRALFNGSTGMIHKWSLWPGYEHCNNQDATVVGAWSLAIQNKIITNGGTLEIFGLNDGGGGVSSKVIDLGNLGRLF